MDPGKTDRIETGRAVLVLIATLATIAFNGIAAAGMLNGVSPAEVSDRYPTSVTPSGYAFSIWTVIYVGLFCFSIYQILPSAIQRFSRIRTLYLLSCVLNCAWIYFWHQGQIAVCFVLIVILAFILGLLTSRLPDSPSFIGSAAGRAPFSVYLGWVSAAALVNLAILTVYLGYDIVAPGRAAGAVLLLAAAVIALFFRVFLRDHLAPLSIAWALTAIAVKQSGNTLVVSAAALGVVACLIASISFIMNLRNSDNE